MESGVACKPVNVHQNSVHDCLGMLQSLQEEVSQLQRGNASLIDTVAGLKVQVNATQKAAMYYCHDCTAPSNMLCCASAIMPFRV